MHALQQIEYIERFHLLFLARLGQKLDKRFYALKGGCNLRFFFKSIRYSEDMDLDVQTIPVSELRGRVAGILKSVPFRPTCSKKPNNGAWRCGSGISRARFCRILPRTIRPLMMIPRCGTIWFCA